jgi:ankyrin repeat protein
MDGPRVAAIVAVFVSASVAIAAVFVPLGSPATAPPTAVAPAVTVTGTPLPAKPFDAALEAEDDAAAVRLLESADVNVMSDGRRPLGDAAWEGRRQVVRALLDRGANPNLSNRDGYTPLMGAAAQGDVETISLLLDKGADVRAVQEWPRGNAFTEAATHNRVPVMKALIAAKLDPKPWRDLALLRAAGAGQLEASRFLLDLGASPNAAYPPPTEDSSVLMRAIQPEFDRSLSPRAMRLPGRRGPNYDVPLVALLIERGANVNARNQGKETPLHCAVGKEPVHVQMATLLLDHGADRSARDRQGHTPLEKARLQGSPELVSVLEGYGGAR